MKLMRSISNCGEPIITTFNEKFETVGTLAAKSEGLCRRLVFALDDGALAIFGEQVRGNVTTAAIGWIDPIQHRAESLVFQPTYGSPWVDVAVPTGSPGEFVAVRDLVAGMHHTFGGPDESRSGVLLMFIRFH